MRMMVLLFIFFSKDKVNEISEGFEILDIEKFEEGKFPRKLFKVVLKKVEN